MFTNKLNKITKYLGKKTSQLGQVICEQALNMKQTRIQMGMHITIEIVDKNVRQKDFDTVFNYFTYIENKFSTYKESSEISQINKGKLPKNKYSSDMKTVLMLCEQTKNETNGYFDMHHNGKIDTTGIVKGWSIWKAADILKKRGFKNYYIDAGGDVQTSGRNNEGSEWKVGIQNPFNKDQIVKVVSLKDRGIATSGTAVRGQHIYNPHKPNSEIRDIVSLTVIGPNVCEADRFATPAFAMGLKGIHFIENLPGFEGYMIGRNGIAAYTSGFDKFTIKN